MSPPTTLGQGALHAGDHDQAVGRRELVADVEQPVQAGHADVADRVDTGAMDARGEHRLGGDRRVGGAGRDHGHQSRAPRASARGRRPGRPRRRRRRAARGAPRPAPRAESRVASTARSGCRSCSRPRMPTTCWGVLPAPYTTSGSPVRRGAVDVEPGVAQVVGAAVVSHGSRRPGRRRAPSRRW